MADGSRRTAQEREEARREREAARVAREASQPAGYDDENGGSHSDSDAAGAIDEPLVQPRDNAPAPADEVREPDSDSLQHDRISENGDVPGGPAIK